jgi:hypothetical protein
MAGKIGFMKGVSEADPAHRMPHVGAPTPARHPAQQPNVSVPMMRLWGIANTC